MTNIKATEVTKDFLHDLKENKQEEFENVDWTGASSELLLEFFPLQEGYGNLDPAPNFSITNTISMQMWRFYPQEVQEAYHVKVDLPEGYSIDDINAQFKSITDAFDTMNKSIADWSVVFVEENGDITPFSADVHSGTMLASALEWFREFKRTPFLLSRILYQFWHNDTLLPFDCNETLEQLGRNNIIIHVTVQHIVSRQGFDSQLADIDIYVNKNPYSFIGQQVAKSLNERTLGRVIQYTKNEKGGYFTVLFLDDDTVDIPIDTFIGALRQYYFDPTIDGFTQDLWLYLNEQIQGFNSKLDKLDVGIKNLGTDRVDKNEMMLKVLKVVQDIELCLIFSVSTTQSTSYIAIAGGVCPRAFSCYERLKSQFNAVNKMKKSILFKATQKVNKPMFEIGDFVNAEWSSDNNAITYKRGVVKSYEEDDEEDDGYGPHRVYKVEFDNGITRDNIGDHEIGEHPEADWMGPSNWYKQTGSPKGVNFGLDDVSTTDKWATGVGWHVATIDSIGVPFVRLSDAIRARDISTVLSKYKELSWKDDVNFPGDWHAKWEREDITLELHLLIAVERLTNPEMRQIGRVLVYLIHPGGNLEEKKSLGHTWIRAYEHCLDASSVQMKTRLYTFAFAQCFNHLDLNYRQICRFFIGAKGDIDKFLQMVPLFCEAYKAATAQPLEYLSKYRPEDTNDFMSIKFVNGKETKIYTVACDAPIKALLTKYAADRDTSVKSLRIKTNGKLLFLSSIGKKTPLDLGMKEEDELEITIMQSTATEAIANDQPKPPSSKGKKNNKKKHKKSKKKRTQPLVIQKTEAELRGEHSKLLGKVYEEAEPAFKEIRQRLNALNLERTKPKQRTSPSKATKPVEVVDNPLDDGQLLGGKAGKTQFIIQVGEVSNLYKTTKPTAGRGRRQDDIIDLHGLSAEEAVYRLDKHLPSWIETAMKGTYPFVIPVKIICGGGSQIIAEVVENWIKQNDNVANAPRNMYT